MRVLVACEFSGVVRDAFAARGHDAWSCDLLPSERPGQHVVGDVRALLAEPWDLVIAHPPCTVLSRAGARWWRFREAEQVTAAQFVRELWAAPVARLAIENPIGRLNQLWRYPDQTIEPCYFGEPYTKRTCLWLRGLAPLMATVVVAGATSWVDGATFCRVSRRRRARGPAQSPKDRARTLPGVAAAMADQWGGR